MKNIIFDLGGVILYDKPNSVLLNFNLDKDVYNELNIFFNDWNELDLGKKTLEEKYNECNFLDEINIKYKDFLLNYYKYRKINIELIDMINKLKENNYDIYILSDNNHETYNYYKNHPFFKNIDGWIVSCEYGVLKKDGKLFNILIDKYNLNPSECYFIDDKVENIKEAQKLGIKGYVFDNNNNLYQDIRNNGFDI